MGMKIIDNNGNGLIINDSGSRLRLLTVTDHNKLQTVATFSGIVGKEKFVDTLLGLLESVASGGGGNDDNRSC